MKGLVRHKHFKCALGGVLVALLGWQISLRPFGDWLTAFSYDLPFLLSTTASPRNVVLIEMDEISHRELHQEYGQPWDRALHAQLLDHLRQQGSNVVVFDIVFADPGTNAAANESLARAMREHGRVVIAGDVDRSRNPIRVLPPDDLFRNAAHRWGPTQAELADTDGVIRKIYSGTEQTPSLAWAAASLVNPAIATSPEAHWQERWLRYYGPGHTLQRVSYSQATSRPAGFFNGKSIFIGGRPKTRFVTDEVDEFMTPWRLHGAAQISGLELTATSFLNLARGDFLTRPGSASEGIIIALAGIIAGIALGMQRPLRALLLAVGGGLAVLVMALVLFFQWRMWFNWSAIALVQIPCALAWSLGWQWWQLKKEKEFLETPLGDLWDAIPSDKSDKPDSTGTPAPAAATTAIPDHELLRQVGRGAYGDVWLARDIVGSLHVVKIVRRVSFDHAEPYEREFRGLQKFTPLSRAHPGLVQILHVGRVPNEESFYYVMEAGDDEKTGAAIEPTNYSPRNLGRDLRRRAPLPPDECIRIIAALCDALEFLHGQGLLHRDIKPANIIFVNGQPKLADVGLVTAMSDNLSAMSKVGTDGFIPPEGPGTASADIFALGKVLEAMLRRPETQMLPPSDEARERLRFIAHKAGAENAAERYASAAEFKRALPA